MVLVTRFDMAREPIGSGKGKKIRKSWPGPKPWVVGILECAAALFLLCWLGSHSLFSDFSPSAAPRMTASWPFDWNESVWPVQSNSHSDSPVYPYSVIPGGVTSSTKLRTALRQDPVAAAHYRNFQTHSARVVQLASERHVYVSYRVADRIFWTRKKVTLRAGETLLSDGIHLARTRCGNRISQVPAEPTAPSEPPSEVLNTPVSPRLPVISPDPVPDAPLWTNEYPPFPLFPRSTPPSGEIPFLPLFPLIPCCGGSSGSIPSSIPPSGPLPQPGLGPSPLPSPLPQPFPGPPPPTAVPEPRSIVLLTIGLAGLLFLWKFRRF